MSSEQLQEYQSQLKDIEDLLVDDPTDESLLKLKADLVELIALTMEDSAEQQDANSATITTTIVHHHPPGKVSVCANDTIESTEDVHDMEQHAIKIKSTMTLASTDTTLTTPATSAEPLADLVHHKEEEMIPGAAVIAAGEPQRKKLKKLKEFEIPSHLQILETDTEKEKTKKKRALKSLKSKHREKQREYESTKKQQSWQSFNKKTNKKSNDSIFATQDGVNSKVGVVSGGSGMTEFQERKRHKY